eukprot:CAMPEP_0114534416 /NCGR_PEP_ID=MMETSP0109-20121206/27827_1 /TAXON_ID=29199 /ORGANISM="Chlorarachnion reptans, Strain CCCM449" /LENGTH=785 /DNA_ID=CAMNT_0001717825 /DNA_START=168 /DNA_END=2524 /DNA_ORIENTATION=+
MGNKQARRKGGETEEAKRVFAKDELNILEHVFEDLASRSPGPTMDKDAFAAFFKLPGIIGELLYNVFDRDRNGAIDQSEFVNGLARYYRGTLEEKLSMLFSMYDSAERKSLSKLELTTLMHSLVTPEAALAANADSKPTEPLIMLATNLRNRGPDKNDRDKSSPRRPSLAVQDRMRQRSHRTEEEPPFKIGILDCWTVVLVCVGSHCGPQKPDCLRTEFSDPSLLHYFKAAYEQTEWMVEELVDECMQKCNGATTNRVQLFEFKQWILHNPKVKNILENLFYTNSWCLFPSKTPQQRSTSTMSSVATKGGMTSSSLPTMSLSSHSHLALGDPRRRSTGERNATAFELSSGKRSTDMVETPDTHIAVSRADLNLACERGVLRAEQVESLWKFLASLRPDDKYEKVRGAVDDPSSSIRYSGFLYKLGSKIGGYRRRWCTIQHSFFYEFKAQGDSLPSKVIFLEGYCFQEGNMAKPGYYAIEMAQDDQTRFYFCKDPEGKEGWIEALREAGKCKPFDQHYKIKNQIGRGRFSTVHRAANVKTNEAVAVKIIEKKRMSAPKHQREALRTEIAILKLVKHPNIVRMRDIFETADIIYIVMDIMRAGDLFARIVKRKILPEYTTRKIIYQLLSAVSYLHRRGIVHRDLKPENILCTSEEDDTKVIIADFGLSKFARPTQLMRMPCGTLAYVAPEVLQNRGYSKAVDLWSIGVIFYLLLRGGLPFDGKSKADVVHRTLSSQVSFRHPRWKYVSPMACNLLRRFLIKDPDSRIDVVEALHDPWFDSVRRRVSA